MVKTYLYTSVGKLLMLSKNMKPKLFVTCEFIDNFTMNVYQYPLYSKIIHT